jgi:hypothetical protein
MKLTTSILTVTAAMIASGAWAQTSNVVTNVQSSMTAVQQQKTNDSNAALGVTGKPASSQSAKPSASPSKPAAAQASQPAKPTPAQASKPATAPSVKPAAAQAAKPAMAQPAKPAATATSKTVTVTPATRKQATAKPTTGVPLVAGKSPSVAVAVSAKPKTDPMVEKNAKSKAVIVAKEPSLQVVSKTATPDAKAAADAKVAGPVKAVEAPKPPKPEEKKWAMNGKRDPFFSPVVQQPTGSGCSTGKKCLEIGQINLRGVVKADSGFIAVVTNSLNKAYFLHENDPVFNGYVMKITGDSVVFSETGQDKLGKPLVHEVTKKITTPAV